MLLRKRKNVNYAEKPDACVEERSERNPRKKRTATTTTTNRFAAMTSTYSYMTLSGIDLDCLEPGEFLTDRMIEFWMCRIEDALPIASRSSFAFASPLFFSTLGHGLFDMDVDASTKFRFVPIHHQNHWSVVVVVTTGSNEKVALHLDSLRRSSHTKKVLAPLLDFLGGPELVRFGAMSLPCQDNTYDCGLFMLAYIEYFCDAVAGFDAVMVDAPFGALVDGEKQEKAAARAEMRLINRHGADMLSREWFPEENAGLLRDRMRAALMGVLLIGNSDNDGDDLRRLIDAYEKSPTTVKYVTPDSRHTHTL